MTPDPSTPLHDVAALIETRLGLRIDEDRLGDLRELVEARVRALQLPGVTAYAAMLSGAATGSAEIGVIANRLTVAETSFFRHREQFDAFVEVALRDRLAGPAGQGPLRLLSAGCATGEEAYTLAILLREHAPSAALDAVIRGVDISPAALERARRAVYSAWSLRETPPELRARYFTRSGSHFALHENVRRAATFHRGNILDPAVGAADGPYDVIFCRNVLIYFGPDALRTAVRRLTEALAPGGYLFLGHAESLRGLTDQFDLLHVHGTFFYRHRSGGDARAKATGAVAQVARADGDWMDAIRRSTERIASLASPGQQASAATAAPGWDRPRILALVEQERFDEAAAALDALPAPAAGDPDVQLMRAVVHTNRGELAAARSACERLLEQAPGNAAAHYVMALCCEEAGDAAGALHHDSMAAQLDPTFAMPRLHRGLMARRAGDLARADAELTAALALLEREEAARIALFGGGFSRDALMRMCTERRAQ